MTANTTPSGIHLTPDDFDRLAGILAAAPAPHGLLPHRLNPAAQQAADFGHHPADVLVPPQRQPAPLLGQSQVQPDLVELGVGLAQVAQASCRRTPG
jgi:hypothetical protein